MKMILNGYSGWSLFLTVKEGNFWDHVRSVQYICTHTSCGGTAEGAGYVDFPLTQSNITLPDGKRIRELIFNSKFSIMT